MTKEALITITEENRDEIRRHAIKSITQLQTSLVTLKGDLNHKHDEVVDGACYIAASICLAVEDAIQYANNDLAKRKKK